jgi:hypothetical protein
MIFPSPGPDYHPTAPFWPDIFLVLVFMPPILTGLWWMMSRGTGAALQGGEMSARSKRGVDGNFWRLLILLYVISLGIFLYAYFR